MNDFTKEELEMLWEHSHCLPGEFRPFLDKVRIMIDKYCEHKETYTDYDSQPERCKKCLDVVE